MRLFISTLILFTCASLDAADRAPLITKEYNEQLSQEAKGKWRVMDGQDATLGQFPFVVGLNGCTGSLLDLSTVITAVHCVCSGQSTVWAGILNKYHNNAQQERRVVSIHKHPDHEGRLPKVCMAAGPYDIAIMKLDRPFDLSRTVQPFTRVHCGSSAPPAGTSIVNVGYGVSRPNESGILRFGYNTLVEPCNNYPGFICSDRDDRQGRRLNVIAPGDSGGPVVRRLGDGSYELIGINSGGFDHRGFYAPTYLACNFIRQYARV